MEYEVSSSTPKLSLSKLPSKPRNLTDILTPPLKSRASIPFDWEVAPGQPKTTAISSATAEINTPPPTPPPKNKSAAARCLELPPRLLLNDHATIASPTTVFDGPYEYSQRSLSQPKALSFSFRKGSFKTKQRSSSRYGSWRFSGSFKEDRKLIPNNNKGTNVKITRVTRKGNFFNFFAIASTNPLVGIYENFKLAVPWGRRHERP